MLWTSRKPRVLNAAYQRRWLDSLQPEDQSKPNGQQYGYGIAQMRWGPNTIYFHGGETPGYNSFIGYDPGNQVTIVIWINLTVSLDEQPTANVLMLKVLDSDLRGVTTATIPTITERMNVPWESAWRK
jgi:D-alanyl-D-alanine carboxypeptidase